MPEAVAGLVLWASYPPENNPLNDRDLPVLSIYGTKDMGLEGIEANRGLLPPDTQWVVMEGGNHAQFGWYGPQPGDGEATISREAQQARIVEATVAFLAVFK
jgi:pimeloyl-ACP methyl ester carboxylesterase